MTSSFQLRTRPFFYGKGEERSLTEKDDGEIVNIQWIDDPERNVVVATLNWKKRADFGLQQFLEWLNTHFTGSLIKVSFTENYSDSTILEAGLPLTIPEFEAQLPFSLSRLRKILVMKYLPEPMDIHFCVIEEGPLGAGSGIGVVTEQLRTLRQERILKLVGISSPYPLSNELLISALADPPSTE